MHHGLIKQMLRFENKYSKSFDNANFTRRGSEYSDPAVNDAWKTFEYEEWKRSMELIGPGSGPFPGRRRKR